MAINSSLAAPLCRSRADLSDVLERKMVLHAWMWAQHRGRRPCASAFRLAGTPESAPSSALHQAAAVDGYGGAGNERREIGAQPRHGRRDLSGIAQAAQRDCPCNRRALLVRERR